MINPLTCNRRLSYSVWRSRVGESICVPTQVRTSGLANLAHAGMLPLCNTNPDLEQENIPAGPAFPIQYLAKFWRTAYDTRLVKGFTRTHPDSAPVGVGRGRCLRVSRAGRATDHREGSGQGSPQGSHRRERGGQGSRSRQGSGGHSGDLREEDPRGRGGPGSPRGQGRGEGEPLLHRRGQARRVHQHEPVRRRAPADDPPVVGVEHEHGPPVQQPHRVQPGDRGPGGPPVRPVRKLGAGR